MNAIRVVFDGKVFVPQEPVALPAQSEALVLLESLDPATQAALDRAVREYYETGPDADDDAWARATATESHRAWDED
jgi:hypothetical protein